MKSYFIRPNKKTVVFVAQEQYGLFRILRMNNETKRIGALCRREFRTMKRAQDRLDEIAQVLGWETAHYTYE